MRNIGLDYLDYLKYCCYVKLLRKETRALLLRVSLSHGNMATIAAEVKAGLVPTHIQALEIAAVWQGQLLYIVQCFGTVCFLFLNFK